MHLATQLSHANTTNLGAVMGTVRYVETGITNFAHRIMKKIVNDKIAHTPGPKVEGAIVLSPKIGLHEWIASVDIQSLYRETPEEPAFVWGDREQFARFRNAAFN